MGTVLSTHNGVNSPRPEGLYKYPPFHETYFSKQYYLGHRRFETGDPEVFLFGDLHDVNYLHSKPVKFPYKQPPKSKPLNTLRSYINVQRESIKLVKGTGLTNDYYLQFTFDSDFPCKFTIFRSLPDSISVDNLRTSGEANRCINYSRTGTYKYNTGSEQVFHEEDEVIHPAELTGEGKSYDPTNGLNTVPLALLMETDNNDASDSEQQALISYCTIESFGEDNFSIKIIKQKLLADGMELLLQELYGLENKLKPAEEDEADSDSDSEEEDLGTECVICITDIRDTLLLPCRHFCLCSSCAANLRYQSSNCPICRAPFQALLQIKALEPLDPNVVLDDDEFTGNPKYSLPGYQHVPLLQALNGYHFKDDDHVETRVQASAQTLPQNPLESPTSPTTSTEVTTEFCVIPIEDDEIADPITPEPVETPMKKPALMDGQSTARVSNGTLEHSDTILLPGTPDIDHITTLPKVHEVDSGDAQVSLCGSSVSSEVSVKSTDVLLTL